MAKILVVDDERDACWHLAAALGALGHDVDTAKDGAEGVERALEQVYDLVLTELRVPVRDGMEVLRAVKRECPDTNVVVLASDGGVEEAVEAMRFGAADYIRRPVPIDELSRRVARVLEDRAPRPSAPRPDRYGTSFPNIIGQSREIRDLLDLVAKVAATDSTVLITGETGTGKELVGRAIHEASPRRGRIFCAVNSAAFPDTLLESELFGHRRGAFTGASSTKKGLFEYAHHGTVFLDEVAEMPLSMQAKLLRFLQTGEIRAVGGEATRCVDVRLVTATNKDLEAEVRAGRFREDLYYRLAVIPLHVPPLRQRVDDIPLLASHFLRCFAAKLGKRVERIEPDALDLMLHYPWPGNVRELENSIERGVALCRGHTLTVGDLPARVRERAAPIESDNLESLETLERTHILRTLDRVGWNRKRAAEILQISTTTLWRRLKEFGVEAPGGSFGAGRY